jgi:uncharacterized phage protein (TIGR01671 family)
MDEILFKAKRKDNGEWIEGVPYAEYMICGMTTAYCDDEVPRSNYVEFDYIEIIPETIGKYIGKKDKNGVKIFKGDIIKTNTESVVAVSWSNIRTAYVFITSGVKGGWVHPIDGIGSEFEIIGNVHDNHSD